jgi:N6-adenosine-specific RNA methylase IME4
MIEFHPLANIFPLLEGDERSEFFEDVKRNRLRQKIDILDGMILDGRNRYNAALFAGLVERDTRPEDRPSLFRKYLAEIDGDPLAYVISQNLKRRHLNESQRAMVAARLANLPQGQPRPDPEKPANLPVTQADAAGQLRVSERLVRSAKAVQENAQPELSLAVDQGRLSVSAAAQASSLPAETQRKIAELAAENKPNVIRTVIKQETRAAREKTTGLKAPEGKFGVVVEDFEWDYEVYSRETGLDRHAANHYEVAEDAHTPEEIVKRTADRFACADDNCVLWMWAPAPHLSIAIKVLELRGFKYVSNYVWKKPTIITGWWARFKHEHLLIGVKGSVPCPAPGKQWDSVIEAALGEHSAKPEAFLEMIEGYFPTWRKIELNRRGPPRLGWSAWGNEAEPAPIDPILAQHKARKQFPVGHTVAMTNPVVDGVCTEIATCECGMKWSAPWDDPGRHNTLDAAIERHWQKFDHFAAKVDSRGQPIADAPQWTPEEVAQAPIDKPPITFLEPTDADEWGCSRGAGCACAENTRGDCPFWRRAPEEAAA